MDTAPTLVHRARELLHLHVLWKGLPNKDTLIMKYAHLRWTLNHRNADLTDGVVWRGVVWCGVVCCGVVCVCVRVFVCMFCSTLYHLRTYVNF